MWRYGRFPCGSEATCECLNPGNSHPRLNGYRCSVSKYDGKCGSDQACLTPRGHVWNVGNAPCGPGNVAKLLGKYGAYKETSLESACSRVMVGVDDANAHLCSVYEKLVLIQPNCSARETVVPRILHTVGNRDSHYIESSVAAANPSFKRKRQNDLSAATFILEKCGTEAAEAYRCLAPPSYRADLFRFCALYAEGGIYLDEDIVPLHPLMQIISPCSTATVGHDFPADQKPAKQMKILAAAPGAEIMKCALETIVKSVRQRAYPPSPLELSGPLMLESCYEKHPDDVAVTYIDTRNSIWPYTGMRARNKILAYEYPDSPKHFCKGMECFDMNDYANAYAERKVYRKSCKLLPADSEKSTALKYGKN